MSDVEGRLGGQKSQREPLILRRAATTRRVDALFKAMSTDFLLREQFITDPSQIMSEYVHGTSLSPEKASISNQLLYSVMSNPRLLGWLRDYAIKYGGNPPSRGQFAIDFGRAVADSGGHHVILALLRNSVEKEAAVGFDEVLLPLIFGIFTGGGLVAGTEMSTGTGGTEMSTGNIFASGTEMSTGGGTEMSTGTGGTEMSTGNRPGLGVSRHALVTLEALAIYATQLRQAGALDVVWSE